MADIDDTSEIEAAVMRNLSYVSPSPERNGLGSPTHSSEKKADKQRKRKLKATEEVLPSDAMIVTENLAQAVKAAEKRALRLALTSSGRANRNEEPVRRKHTTTAAEVFQAADIKAQAPRRRPRLQSKTSAEEKTHADASEVVERYRREVGRFGSRALHKRDRKMYETAELTKLGCRKPKNEKMPIGILTKKRKYQKIREQKKKEMDLATGMLVRTRRR